MTKNYSPSVDRNKEAILKILKIYLTNGRLLEIGSGTGQHAIFFAEHFRNLHWVTSDVKPNHADIKSWLAEAKMKNVHGPEVLKIGKDDFPKGAFDYVFTANTLHIMSWKEDKAFFKLLGKRLRELSLAIFYGPFNYGGEFTSESNSKFNESLKERDPKSGIRNFEDVRQNMEKAGFEFIDDHEMPANNRILVFERLPFTK
jgi:cyclopropane fatty-acyl-phospholipid synthase-like methyltransferase